MKPVILSGGSGTRLWPLSRGAYPKQFLPLTSDNTMLQETILRLRGIDDMSAPLVICNEAHRFLVAEQLREIDIKPHVIMLEPVGRNTAPAVALAALAVDPDEVLLILPADHVIDNIEAYHAVVEQGVCEAEKDHLVTFGIIPSGPETGYGYIQAKKEESDGLSYKVNRFVEKPDLVTAAEYLDSGDYYWNSGMFVFKASRYLDELEKFNPQMLAACKAAYTHAKEDADFTRIDRVAFEACEADSIDYVVMEKTGSAVVIPLDADWNDVGSWSALWEISGKDSNGNTLKGDVLTHDTKNSYIYSDQKLVATVGVRDLVIIESDDAVMVAPKNRVQEVKEIVAQLKAKKRSECDVHRKVYRPWGYYDSIDNGERHQAKRIVVKPGGKLSLQMHHHRAEHWIVVKGTAQVIRGDEQFIVSENESTYIPLGTVHSLENRGVIPLEMIEVQSGSYLGEDDIVRFEDKYGRALKTT